MTNGYHPQRSQHEPRTEYPITLNSVAQLLEMNLEPRSLLRRIILGSAQSNHRIQRILTPRCPPLPSIRSRMMDEQDRNPSPS